MIFLNFLKTPNRYWMFKNMFKCVKTIV